MNIIVETFEFTETELQIFSQLSGVEKLRDGEYSMWFYRCVDLLEFLEEWRLYLFIDYDLKNPQSLGIRANREWCLLV